MGTTAAAPEPACRPFVLPFTASRILAAQLSRMSPPTPLSGSKSHNGNRFFSWLDWLVGGLNNRQQVHKRVVDPTKEKIAQLKTCPKLPIRIRCAGNLLQRLQLSFKGNEIHRTVDIQILAIKFPHLPKPNAHPGPTFSPSIVKFTRTMLMLSTKTSVVFWRRSLTF